MDVGWTWQCGLKLKALKLRVVSGIVLGQQKVYVVQNKIPKERKVPLKADFH